jgi:hypothetical protein
MRLVIERWLEVRKSTLDDLVDLDSQQLVKGGNWWVKNDSKR